MTPSPKSLILALGLTLGALNPAAAFDIDAMSERDGKQWVYKGMNCLPKQPEHCLVSLSPGGGDATVTREFNSVTSQFVAGGFELPLAKGGLSWIDEDTVFVATDFGPGSMTDSGYPRVTKRWQRATPLSAAEVIHEGDPSSVAVVVSIAVVDDGVVQRDNIVPRDNFFRNRGIIKTTVNKAG